MLPELKQSWQVARLETARLFATPGGWLFVALLPLLATLLLFFVADLLSQPSAQLEALFRFLPWLLLVLLPGLALRSWRDAPGWTDWLLAQPIAPRALVLGRFLALLGAATAGLAGTFPLWIMATMLGNPDHGAMAAGYLAMLLWAALLLALCSVIMARPGSAIAGFALVLLIGALLLVLAWPLLLSFGGGALGVLAALPRLERLSSGELWLGDLLYFLAIIAALLVLAVQRLRPRRGRALWAFGLLVAATGLSTLMPLTARFDLTLARRFTLAPDAVAALQKLSRPVYLEQLVTEDSVSRFPILMAQDRHVSVLLAQMQAASERKLSFTRQLVAQSPAAAADLKARGIEVQAAPDGQILAMGLAGSNSLNAAMQIGFLDPARADQLQADLLRLALDLADGHKPRLAILTSLPLATGEGGALAALRGESRPFALWPELQRRFDIQLLARLDAPLTAPLLVIRPSLPEAQAIAAAGVQRKLLLDDDAVLNMPPEASAATQLLARLDLLTGRLALAKLAHAAQARPRLVRLETMRAALIAQTQQRTDRLTSKMMALRARSLGGDASVQAQFVQLDLALQSTVARGQQSLRQLDQRIIALTMLPVPMALFIMAFLYLHRRNRQRA